MTEPPRLLENISDPADLRKLDRRQLPQLARELREFIIDSVSRTGGHLSSNLGTIELTIALHYVFDTPDDRIVWDVGHQTYAHKVLTGRREAMSTLRQLHGLAGFPRREESRYDTFGTAHSSTSIGAALGMDGASFIARAGKPVARLSAYVPPKRKILPPGSFKHTDWWVIPDDFDDPIDDMFDVLKDDDDDWLSPPKQP